MTYGRYILASLLTAVLSTAQAAEDKTLTYADFEASVTHLDLENCPKELDQTGVFCRLAIGSDALHVYVFSEDGDSPLVDLRSYDEESYEIVFK